MSRLDQDSSETRRLLESCAGGATHAFAQLFERHRSFLHHIVDVRIDPQLQARIDPSDVVQEVHLEALRRLDEYLDKRPLPFRLWLRQMAYDRMIMARRQHVDAAQRSLKSEEALPAGSAQQLADQLVAQKLTPSEQLMKQEIAQRVRQAVARLTDDDQEILLMINFEGLNSREVAQLLDIKPATVRKRYGRILIKLQKLLSEFGLSGTQ